MTDKPINILFCYKCNKRIVYKESFQGGDIFACDCCEYPRIYGILYLKNKIKAKKAVSCLKKGEKFESLKILLDGRKKTFVLIYLIINLKLDSILGYKNAVKLIYSSAADKGWKKYLLDREKSDYFKLSGKIISYYKKKNIRLLDVGCGVGHIFNYIDDKIELVGVDDNFLHLILASLFGFHKNNILICLDAEKKLPFIDNSFNIVHMNDTFHYINDKKRLLLDSNKVLTKNGKLIIVHTHKRKMKWKIVGIKETKLFKMLKVTGFKNVGAWSDKLLYLQFLLEGGCCNESEKLNPKNLEEAYTVIASKTSLLFFKTKANIKQYVFISPHLDDAVLSSGNLILKLINSGRKVLIITIFTKAKEKAKSPQAIEYLKLCEAKDAVKLYDLRKKEDIGVSRFLGVKWKHLNFVDAAFRNDSQGNPIYKNAKNQFSGSVSKKDSILLPKISSQIKSVLKEKQSIILAPIGIGGHVDHVITRKVVEKLTHPKVYWEDFPYNNEQRNSTQINRINNVVMKDYLKISFERFNYPDKLAAIKLYKSQMKVLFPNGKIPLTPETYYFKDMTN